MYDREMAGRAILSPFGPGLTAGLAEKEMTDGFKHAVRSIIVAPYQVPAIKKIQKEYQNGYTRVGMIIGYPYGGLSTEMKVHLMEYAVENELDEIDFGIDISAILSGDFARAENELQQVIKASQGKVDIVPLVWAVRIPLHLTEKICSMYVRLGIKRIKTSPGNHFGDMELEHVEFISRRFKGLLEIEVAGRCRTREMAEAMTLAGAESFHISSWRRMSGIGNDVSFNYAAKAAEYTEYKDRLKINK